MQYEILDRNNSSALQTPELRERCINSFKETHESLEGFKSPLNSYRKGLGLTTEEREQLEEFGGFLLDRPDVVDKERNPKDWSDSAYVRLQMSWGGPSDEFRVWKSGKIEYVFLDWYTGFSIDVTQNDAVQWLYNYYLDYGIAFRGNSYHSHEDLFEAIIAYEKG